MCSFSRGAGSAAAADASTGRANVEAATQFGAGTVVETSGGLRIANGRASQNARALVAVFAETGSYQRDDHFQFSVTSAVR